MSKLFPAPFLFNVNQHQTSMKFLYKIAFPGIFCALFTCCRDDHAPMPFDPPELPDFPHVDVFLPCDTAEGVASAIKISAEWTAATWRRTILISGKKYWVIELATCNQFEEYREVVVLTGIPDDHPIQRFPITSNNDLIGAEHIYTAYARLTADGDVLEDYYYLDTTSTDNYLQIDRWDREKKEAEGHFRVSYTIRQPRYNPNNPEQVKFWKGRFRLRLPE